MPQSFENKFIETDPRCSWKAVFPHASVPVFCQDHAGYALFYTPGWVVKVPREMVANFTAALHSHSGVDLEPARELLRWAHQAERQWEELHNRPFEPLCLTLYLNNTCNLNCGYCFSEPAAGSSAHLSLGAIQAAAEIVIRNCQAKGKPFTVAFHGGGEPSIDHELIFQSLDWLEERTRQSDLVLFRYLATNGVMSLDLAHRLAARFDLIGLSCDGPADIQESQRPFRQPGKHSSTLYVERTARAVHAAGRALHVRVTVTPASMPRQAEIAEYICSWLRPQEINAEPVYAYGRAKNGFTFRGDLAEEYVQAFFEAQAVSRQYGVRWSASGSRPTEIHDTYCHLWRDVLNLTPEGTASACFLLSRARDVQERGLDLGGWDEPSGSFLVDPGRVETLRKRLWREPAECAVCFNRYSCSRQCPEVCLMEDQEPGTGFRCRVNAGIADRAIQQAAERLGGRTLPAGCAVIP